MRIFLTPLDRREFIFSPFLGFEVSDAKEIKECIVKHCFKEVFQKKASFLKLILLI